MTTLTATFARLADQTWGVRVNGPRPTPGSAVTVAKRDGTTKTAQIASVLWHGVAKDGQEASLCGIVEDRPARRNSGRGRDYYIARRNYEATGDYYGSGLYDEES